MEVTFSENANTLFERLEKFFTSKTVVGEMIQVGNVSLIPIISISFGLGAGVGDSGSAKGAKGKGGGGGVGAKATPTALVVVKGEDIQVIPFQNQGGLDKLIHMVPEFIAKIKPKKEKEEKNQVKN